MKEIETAMKTKTDMKNAAAYRCINILANKQRRYFGTLSFASEFSGAQGKALHYILENYDKELFQKDLEEEFGLRPPTATVLLQHMEQNGLISRERSSLDARFKKIVAAEKARSYAPILSRDLSKLEFALTAGIAPEDLAIWKKVTAQMLQNL